MLAFKSRFNPLQLDTSHGSNGLPVASSMGKCPWKMVLGPSSPPQGTKLMHGTNGRKYANVTLGSFLLSLIVFVMEVATDERIQAFALGLNQGPIPNVLQSCPKCGGNVLGVQTSLAKNGNMKHLDLIEYKCWKRQDGSSAPCFFHWLSGFDPLDAFPSEPAFGFQTIELIHSLNAAALHDMVTLMKFLDRHVKWGTKGSRKELAEAWCKAMPSCTLAYVTLGLLDRFVDAGGSEKGTWAQVKAKVKPLIPEHGRKLSAAGESDCDMGVEEGIQSGSSDESDSDICMMESMRFNIFEMARNAKTLFNVDIASLNKGTFTARALYSYDRKFVFPVKSRRKFHEVVFMEVEYPPEESATGANVSKLLAAKKLRIPAAPSADWSMEDATWVEAYRMYSVRLMVNAFMNDTPNFSDGATPQLIGMLSHAGHNSLLTLGQILKSSRPST
ncbi:hypothetical protein BKA70DRAFT_1238751 [Coprinopsis sp. MPI-PUGE-AT-0042]|nr:hypothetical protein BKA70DRAFT_1238751 [Coprinopsis sp. MPI-PUGE-AT-0042]